MQKPSPAIPIARFTDSQAEEWLKEHGVDYTEQYLSLALGWPRAKVRRFKRQHPEFKWVDKRVKNAKPRKRKPVKEVMPNSASGRRNTTERLQPDNAQPQLASPHPEHLSKEPAGALPFGVSRMPSLELAPAPAPRPRKAIAPGLGLILTAIGYAMIPLAVGINAQTGWRFGTTPEAAVTFAGLSGIADALAIWLPSGAVDLWLARRWISSASAWAVWAVVVTSAALASVGFASLNLTDTAAARAAAIDTAKIGAEQRTARIETAKEARIAATLARQSECQIRGPKCRDLERQEQARMTEHSAAVAAPVPVVPPIADPDPQVTGALRLLTWVGVKVTAADVGNLRLALMGLLPNLAGLVLAFSCALRRPA